MAVTKLVIDTNNYGPDRDGRIADLDEQKTATSELLASHLPDSRIVKAFNAIRMDDLESWAVPRLRPARSRRADF